MSIICIFCEIVKNTEPADIIWEDRYSICFAPLKMESFGHVLVLPKRHVKDIFVADKSDLTKIAGALKAVSKILKSKLGATGVNIFNANDHSAQQSVNHLHFHVIPRFPDDKLDLWPHFPKKKFDKKQILKSLIKKYD